jgi:hypothetical protein
MPLREWEEVQKMLRTMMPEGRGEKGTDTFDLIQEEIVYARWRICG